MNRAVVSVTQQREARDAGVERTIGRTQLRQGDLSDVRRRYGVKGDNEHQDNPTMSTSE